MARNEESKLQQACVTWYRLTYHRKKLSLFTIPNGAFLGSDKRRAAMQANKLKREGVVVGAADLFLSIPSGKFHGLYIEMKTTKKTSKQTQNQKDFEKEQLGNGFGYIVIRTYEDFIKTVKSYLESGIYQ